MVRQITAGVCVVLVLALLPGPAASAAPHPTYWFDRTSAVGWIDGDGSHVAVVREGYQADAAWLRLTVGGDSTETDLDWPDAAGDGQQQVALASDSVGNMVVAVAGTVNHELWLNRFGPTGDAVGDTVVIADEVPLQGLPDGSVLTSDTSGTDTVWRSPDGTERARLGLARSQVRRASVDATGRLLVAAADGKIRRWSQAGILDLTLDAGCSATAGFAVVVDAAGGFGSACGTSTGPLTMQVTRYAADGSSLWSLTTEPEAYGIIDPDTGLIDDLGRVWISGTGCRSLDAPPSQRCYLQAPLIRAYGPDGATQEPVDIAYSSSPGGVLAPGVQLRPDGDGVRVYRSVPPDVDARQIWHDGYAFGFAMPETTPAPSCTTGRADVIGADSGTATVSFRGCEFFDRPDSDRNPTQYRIEAVGPASTIAATEVVPAGPPSSTQTGIVSGLEGGVRYRLQVKAENDVGVGPLGWDRSGAMTPPFADQASFLAQQYRDLVGRAPTAAEASQAVARLDLEVASPAATVDSLLGAPWSGPSVEPLARLYRGYFGRNADSSGLRYWVRQRRSGTTLVRISSSFADSSEFGRTYGSLSNRAFVELVYQRVLGRDGDPSGVTFWTGQLDRRRKSRGQLMVDFTESSEFVRRSRPDVDVVSVLYGLLGRTPTSAEAATWVPQLSAGTPRTVLIGSVLGSEEYDQRVHP